MSALLLALLAGVAHAAEPTVRVEGDVVVVDVVVRAPMDRVAAILRSPTEIARIDGGGTEVALIRDDECDELHYSVPSFVGKIEYDVAFCRSPSGSVATLVRSDDMKSYKAVWQATEAEDGVAIHYEILALPAMKLPRRLVLGATKRQVKRLFEKIVVEVEGP